MMELNVLNRRPFSRDRGRLMVLEETQSRCDARAFGSDGARRRGNMRTISDVRAELEDRLAHPSQFDWPPAFLRDVPPNQITEEDEALWVTADGLWRERQAIVARQVWDKIALFGVGL